MPVYWAEVFARSHSGAWAIDNSPGAALNKARRLSGQTEKRERASYVLEFPDGAVVQSVNELRHGFHSNVASTRVVWRNKLTSTDDELLGR